MLTPHFPQPVDIGVMQPEDRIESRCVGVRHQARQLALRVASSDQAVHPVVRLGFDAAVHRSAVRETRVDTAETGASTARYACEVRIVERTQIDLTDRNEHLAVNEPWHHG